MACNSESDQSIDAEVYDRYMNLIGDVLELPQTGIILQHGQIMHEEISRKITDFTIITRIDGTCIQCIVDFEKWKPLLELVEQREDVSIQFYVFTRDMDEFVTYYYPRLGIDNVIRIDTLDSFLLSNNISPRDNRNFHSFLINSERKIEIVGDPTFHENILNFYLQAIAY